MRLPKEFHHLVSENGFNSFGVVNTTRPLSFSKYAEWIEKNHHGEMNYLKRHKENKENLKNLNANINSVLVFSFPYPKSNGSNPFPNLKVALYAQTDDYHVWLNKKLAILTNELIGYFPQSFFQTGTDSLPIMDRDFAFQAGLGWFGKNSCLIDRKIGSLFLIGYILTDILLEPFSSAVTHDFCGTCNRCIEACPTKAILNDRTLDARLCLSYWTIESKSLPPEHLLEKFDDQFFGCDICQTVCPWNQKPLHNLFYNHPAITQIKNTRINPIDGQSLITELRFILSSSEHELKNKIKHSALERSGPFGLKRNAIIVSTNLKLYELKDEILAHAEHPKLKSLVEWSTNKLSES